MSLTNNYLSIFVFPIYHRSLEYTLIILVFTIYQTNSINMNNNHTYDYMLVLEDHTEVKNEAEVGKLSVVSNIDEKGKLRTASTEEAN